MERDKRRMNVVVMGIEEVDEEHDKIEVRKVMDALVEEVKVEVEILGRIGKKGDKSRPIRIKLNDLVDKRRVMFRAKKLRNVVGMERMYVVPDLTKVQQEEDRKLREEVRRMKDEGVASVKISKGSIVVEERD